MKHSALSFVFLVLFLINPCLAKDPEPQPAAKPQEQQYGSVEERRLMESLQKTEASGPFAQEREELENKKKELKRMEGEVDKKIEELNQQRIRLEKLLEQKSAEEEKRTTDLAKMYEKMSSEKAASVLGSIDQQLAISILAKMKTKSAAKVLNSMDKDKAAKLTTAFSAMESK